MEWDDVLKRDDIVGGDIETQESGDVYRGPIKSIEREGDTIVIKAEWMAVMEAGDKEWRKHHITEAFVNATILKPQDIGNGRITFGGHMIGTYVIFPKGGSKLDPSKVKGLDIS